MTLTKRDIAGKVREEVRFKRKKKGPQLFLFPEMDCVLLNRKRAVEIVDQLFEIMKKTLAGGEDVSIRGFGKFRVQFKWARPGRNPQTGEAIIIESRRRVSFKVSPKLKGKLNSKRA
jgi:integration host factor subunit alpha